MAEATDVKPTEGVVDPQKPAEGETGQEDVKTVPLSVLKKVEAELKKAREVNKTVQPAPAAPREAPKRKDPLELLNGREEDDFISVSDVKKILKANQEASGQTSSELAAHLSRLNFAVEHPDYKDKIAQLKPIITQNPELGGLVERAINTSGNALETAYALASVLGAKAEKQDDGDLLSEIDRILANQEKPGSPASVAGGSGMDAKNKYATMSDEEFEQHLLSVKGLG